MKNIIVGFGRTGKALASFFLKKNEDFLIFDENTSSKCYVDFPDYSIKDIGDINIKEIKQLIVSPGISTRYSTLENTTSKLISVAIENNIPILSDIQLFMQIFPEKKYFAITGTNGKSTTTSLLHHIMLECNVNSALCGNIGTSPFENALNADICSVEISSAQIETTKNVEFLISAITNFSPDHLDRYPSADIYYKTKLELLEISQTVIINNNIVKKFNLRNIKKIIPFSIEEHCDGYFIDNNKIYFKEAEICNFPNTNLMGMHNIENILCAFAVCHNFGLEVSKICQAIENFKAIPHRLEYITTKNNVKFFNDSKATNIDSTLNALRSFENPIFLIAGGKLVEDITGLFKKNEFKNVVTIGIVGESSAKIAKEIKTCNEYENCNIKYILCGDISKAVEMLYIEAQKIPNSIILLSPFCKSFDQFKNFEERGEYFIEYIKMLK